MIEVKISAEGQRKLKKSIEKHVAKLMARTATQIYNAILVNNYPYWSGAYMASWNIGIGSPDHSHVPLPKNIGGPPDVTYDVPDLIMDVNVLSPYQPVYISNAVPYAEQIEYVGSPLHPTPWMVATHATNLVVKKARFF